MTLWLAIAGMGILTYAIRLVLFLLLERVPLTGRVRRALGFVPTAVLSAIIAPELLLPGGQLDASLGNVRLLAGLLAAAVAWRTRSVLWTLAVGMAALWLLQLLPGVAG